MAFSSHLAMSLGFFTGIIPSVIFVFLTLKKYDGYFKDRHFFYCLVLGLFAGTMTALIYYWSFDYMSDNLNLAVFLAIIIIFAVFELLLFSIVLSMKRFEDKYELPFYGIVMGGTIGGVVCMFLVYVYTTNLDITPQAAFSIAMVIPTLPMIYMGIGAMIGFGLAKDQSTKFSIYVLIIKTVFNVLFIIWLILFLTEPEESGWQLMVIGLVFAFFFYWYMYNDLLTATLPEKLQKHRRRARRKEKAK
jgi:hypothetical protein